MKSIAILGSTGSVGATTLDIISRFPERFRVVAMAAGYNLDLMAEQVRRFDPELVSVATPELARELAVCVRPRRPAILSGSEGAVAVATHTQAQLVMSALVGALGLRPTLAAIRRLNRRFAFVLNQTPPRGCRLSEAATSLNSLGVLALPYIGQRNDHQDALGAGLGVTEFAQAGRASEEIREL